MRRTIRPRNCLKYIFVRTVVAYTPTRSRGISTPSLTMLHATSHGSDESRNCFNLRAASVSSERTTTGGIFDIESKSFASLRADVWSAATRSPPASGCSLRVVMSKSCASLSIGVIQPLSPSSAALRRRDCPMGSSSSEKRAYASPASSRHPTSPP